MGAIVTEIFSHKKENREKLGHWATLIAGKRGSFGFTVMFNCAQMKIIGICKSKI